MADENQEMPTPDISVQYEQLRAEFDAYKKTQTAAMEAAAKDRDNLTAELKAAREANAMLVTKLPNPEPSNFAPPPAPDTRTVAERAKAAFDNIFDDVVAQQKAYFEKCQGMKI